MRNIRYLTITVAISIASFFGCTKSSLPSADGPAKKMTIGVTFETLNTEYWVAGFDAIKEELAKRDIEVLEVIASPMEEQPPGYYRCDRDRRH